MEQVWERGVKDDQQAQVMKGRVAIYWGRIGWSRI
jgi:hypothetical protein